MKKLLLLSLLSCSIVANTLATTGKKSKKKQNKLTVKKQEQAETKQKKFFFPQDIAFSIAQFLDTPEKLMSLALVDKTCYEGVKQLITSKKFFNKNPRSQALLLALQTQLSTHDKKVIFDQTFENVCKLLKVKTLDLLKEVASN